MKNINKFWGAVAIALLPGALFAQSGNYTITGKVAPLPATAKAYLIYIGAEGDQQIDSSEVTNSGFSFNGTVESPRVAYLMINKLGTGPNQRGMSSVIMYLEPATLILSSPDSLKNSIVTGGPVNADAARAKTALLTANQKMDALKMEYAAATPDQKQSKEFRETMNKRADAIRNEQKQVLISFIQTNPNSVMSFLILKKLGDDGADYTKIEPLFASLSPAIRSSKIGVEYATELEKMKHISIGATAPDFTMADTSGKQVSLHDFKGKYVLIDFWASWCGPCRAENPNVVKNYNKYKDRGFNVLGVSLDQPGAKDKWLKAIHDDHLTWTQVSDLQYMNNVAAKLYSVQAIPENFLISPDGKIVAKDLSGEALNDELDKIFGKM
ncbi:MAG: alkyl hydroperoxide reductase [Mucilaginibacter sp.]|nr:alkyl hydroperoxide reductase [Mucilaginibacter sp.]